MIATPTDGNQPNGVHNPPLFIEVTALLASYLVMLMLSCVMQHCNAALQVRTHRNNRSVNCPLGADGQEGHWTGPEQQL